jgi:hypothetical protein
LFHFWLSHAGLFDSNRPITMETPDQPQKPKRFRWILVGLITLGVLVVIVGLSAPMVIRSYRDPMLGDWYSLRNLGQRLQLYAGENDGKFPDRLEDLEGYQGRWTYFPGFAPADPPDTIVAASSKAFSKADGTQMVGDGPHRMVLSLGGRTFLIEEADYQACIKEQQQSGWTGAKVDETKDAWRFLSDLAWHANDARVLEKEHEPGEISKLIHSLKHGDETTRWNAADALAEIGPLTPEVVPALLEALADSESGYLSAMGLAVMSLKDESIVPSLIEILRTKKGKESYWAAVALEEIGLENAKAAIPLMITELGSVGDIRITAAKALAGAGSDAAEAVPQLMKLTETGDSWDCKCAMIALGRIGPQAHETLGPLGAMFDSGHEYRMDIARALWKIDPAQSPRIVPVLIAKLESQWNPGGPNKQMNNDFFSAIELLGEIGPDAKAAIPILRMNLKGAAKFEAAWALWRIDTGLLVAMTPILASFMEISVTQPNRLDRLAQGSGLSRLDLHSGDTTFNSSVSSRMAALGALWQMHPGKREALSPLLVALLREWEQQKVLNELSPDTRTAIPALEDLSEKSNPPDLRILAKEALQKIKTTDPGRW